MTITTTTAKQRAQTALAHRVEYNQSATTTFGLPDGQWRCDCSGFISAVADLAGGIDCPSTWELTEQFTTLANRNQVIPYRSVTMVTAGNGWPFGHVALITGYDPGSDRLTIAEHGGGLGPYTRILPAGMNYDSEAQYGAYRPFRLYHLNGITGAAPTTPTAPITPVKTTPWPWGPHDYIGPESWGEESHGGYYAAERPLVAAAQRIIGRPATGHFTTADLTAAKQWQLRAITAGRLHIDAADATGRIGPLTFAAMAL